MRNRALYLALRAYVEAAISFLADRCRNLMVLESVRWRPSGPNQLVPITVRHPQLNICLGQHVAELHSLPQYTALRAALSNDPKVREHLDKMVGNRVQGQRYLQTDAVIDGFVLAVANAVGEVRFVEGALEKEYTAAEDAFYGEGIDFVMVAPLNNFTSDSLPIRLTPHLTIENMTDDDLHKCVDAGIIRSPAPNPPNLYLHSRCAIYFRYHGPKIIGDIPPAAGAAEPVASPERFEAISELVTALRLFKNVRIFTLGVLVYCSSWFVPRDMIASSVELVGPRMNTYDLSGRDIEDFTELWQQLQSDRVKNQQAVGNALRRFGFAGDRRRPDDRLVDLMISAESIFLSDTGKPEYRGELRFRLAMRSAWFIGDIGKNTRRQVFNLMKRAYDVRSGIVHGEDNNSIPFAGKTFRLPEFADMVEELIRCALRKRVALCASGRELNWDEMILGS